MIPPKIKSFCHPPAPLPARAYPLPSSVKIFEASIARPLIGEFPCIVRRPRDRTVGRSLGDERARPVARRLSLAEATVGVPGKIASTGGRGRRQSPLRSRRRRSQVHCAGVFELRSRDHLRRDVRRSTVPAAAISQTTYSHSTSSSASFPTSMPG